MTQIRALPTPRRKMLEDRRGGGKAGDSREELEEGRGLLVLELVGSEDLDTASGLGASESLLLAPANEGRRVRGRGAGTNTERSRREG